jgi:hypothetical protein
MLVQRCLFIVFLVFLPGSGYATQLRCRGIDVAQAHPKAGGDFLRLLELV